MAPTRARAGAALLAGDPHLDLTLPSVWYEARIQVPGVVDAYGVTIPGLPAILLGFNRDLAWSFTNSEADLMDRWIERVDDPARPSSYLLDEAWVPIATRLEAYLGPDGDTLALDTVRFSHRGPMRRLGTRWLSTRWTALESSGAIGAIHRAARARSAKAWLDAMTSWDSPPQNLLVADRAGTIAIRTTGRFPIRAGAGRGDRVHDGTSRANDWIGNWPPIGMAPVNQPGTGVSRVRQSGAAGPAGPAALLRRRLARAVAGASHQPPAARRLGGYGRDDATLADRSWQRAR